MIVIITCISAFTEYFFFFFSYLFIHFFSYFFLWYYVDKIVTCLVYGKYLNVRQIKFLLLLEPFGLDLP